MSAGGWGSADVERWATREAWCGPEAATTLAEVRRASSRLAGSWGLEVDEVVSFFWEACQSPGLEAADNRAAYVWAVVRKRVSTAAAARDLLQGDRAASTLKSSRGAAVDAEVDAIERAIASAVIEGGDVFALQAKREELLSNAVSLVPVRGDVLEYLEDVASDVTEVNQIAAVETVVAILVDAGWTQGRSARLVETLIAMAEAISTNGTHGYEAIANRLRRRPGAAGRTGLSRTAFLASIRLIFGSRTSEPGVLPRVFGGEDPAKVRQCPRVGALAYAVTGQLPAQVRAAA